MVATVGQEIVIDAPVDVVWRTVTEPEQVARWFADEVNLQATPGHDGSLTFTGHTTEPDTAPSPTVGNTRRAPRPGSATRCWSPSPSFPKAPVPGCASSRPG
jgi:hypothetical protein